MTMKIEDPASAAWRAGDFQLYVDDQMRRFTWREPHEVIFGAPSKDVYDYRRLVVIDPEDAEQVKRFDDLLERFTVGNEVPDYEGTFGATQAALREFANPTRPKPDEPTGAGALIVDEEGDEWSRRSDGTWVCIGPTGVGAVSTSGWRGFGPDIRVLSEGVSS